MKTSVQAQEFAIIDALGPFIEKTENGTVNWSKVIFSSLETNGRLDSAVQERIVERFELYATRVARLGYTGLSIDDVAHLISFPFYNSQLKNLISDYQNLYTQLFAIAQKKRLKLYLNTDYLFLNPDITQYMNVHGIAPSDFFADALSTLFTQYPQIDGIILRIGENDGKDVTGTFLSQLVLKTPRQANNLLKQILPIFEAHHKTLIFRTWTVGVYRIGDLIWNEKTFNTVFGSIKSDSLIISMKYGDTDFMRYLPLNPLFFASSHKKLIELQTRREWEGMGLYPSFVGWDYANYLVSLRTAENIVGIHVWCQTGGWTRETWSKVTYLENSSLWNELNTEITLAIAHQQSVEAAITSFCDSHDIKDVPRFIELLHLSDIAIKKGLYLPEVAQKNLYFRRTRIPPLIWLTWDRILLSSLVVWLHRMLVSRPEKAIQDGDQAANAAQKMITIARQIHLQPTLIQSLEFEHATLAIFAQLRRYILIGLTKDEQDKLQKQIHVYEKTYPQHYSIPTLPFRTMKRLPFQGSLKLILRESSAYRKRDRLILKTSPLQARAIRYFLKRSRSHLTDQSMGFDAFFK